MSNVDIEIGEGNPGAVAVRSRYAQHCFLAHMDFRIGSGLAGIHEAGNVAEDVHFYGGRYAIWTGTPSPGWQFTMVDATFEGQREAAIRERAAGLTLILPRFQNVPTAIAIEHGFPDDLWVKDARMEDISGPANTWVGTVQPDGSVTDMKLFANQGGEGVAAGKDGNVYIAAGQIYVYSPAGELIHTIEVPEKPLQVVFGGKDGRTLFIPARTSLYAVRP